MAYYIRQLKDNQGNIILPASRAEGIFFSDNTKLSSIMSATSGVVNKAMGDKNGKDIATYLAGASIDDHTLTLTKGDGTPVEITIPDKDTTYNEATTSEAGLMSAADKTKLDGLDASLANKADKTHQHVMADITDLKAMKGASAEAEGATGLVPAPAMGDQGKFLTGAGTWSSVTLATFGVTASATELNYMTGVTSGVQAQLDGKAATVHTHAIADVTDLQTALDAKADKTSIPTVMLTVDETWGGESTELPAFNEDEEST